MFGASYFGKSYFGAPYWGPASAVATVTRSPFYSEFSEYAISDGGEIKQRFPWGKKKGAVNRRDEEDIMDILSVIAGKL